tara:strand:+ start:2978 stop:3121 length:144 start_codon:yes stop_codon:yes gene_type:complete
MPSYATSLPATFSPPKLKTKLKYAKSKPKPISKVDKKKLMKGYKKKK